MKKIKYILGLIVLAYSSYSQVTPSPANLIANNKIDSAIVDLNWYIPGGSNWFQYFDSVEYNYYGGNINFSVGILMDTLQFKDLVGYKISKISMIPTDPTTGYQVKIWKQNGNFTTQIAVQGFDEITYNQWNTVELIEDIYIEQGKNYIIGYYCNSVSNKSASFSKSGVKSGYSDLVNTGSGFFSTSEQSLPLSWNIKVYVEPNPAENLPIPDGFVIYRDNEIIGTSSLNIFRDSLEKNGLFEYNVSAVYDGIESPLSQDAVVVYDTNRIEQNYIIIEEFTSVECPLCPGVANGIRDMVNQGFKVAPIALHTKNFGDDPFNNVWVDERENYYSMVISGYPTTIIGGSNALSGGMHTGSMFSYLAPFYYTALEKKTPIDLDGFLFEELNGGYGLSVDVNNIGIIYPDSILNFHAVLTEDEIDYSWQTVASVEYPLIEYLTATSGYPLNLNANPSKNYQISFNLPDTDLLEHYEVIGFMQNMETKEIFNGIYLKFHEIQYNQHQFRITSNEEPFANAAIQIGVNEIITNALGEASFKHAYKLDSIPFTIRKNSILLHEGYFKPIDSLIEINLIQSAIQVNSNNSIDIYPSPSNSFLYLSNVSNATISFFNILGTHVETLNSTENLISLNVSQWPDGFYLVKIKTENGKLLTKKIVIEH